jgi:hypothetical protein
MSDHAGLRSEKQKKIKAGFNPGNIFILWHMEVSTIMVEENPETPLFIYEAKQVIV